MTLRDWSTTAASNTTVGGISIAEGMNPSAVNDAIRGLIAELAVMRDMLANGTTTGTVGGTADAITLTPTPALVTYAQNQRYLVKASGANTVSNPTLNVSAVGAKTIKLLGGNALAIPQWATNDMLLFAYDGTDMILLSSSRFSEQQFPRNAQTGTTYTVLTGDRGKHVTYSNASAIAVTQPQANSTTFSNGWFHFAENLGAGAVTYTPTTSTINGAATLVLRTGDAYLITSDGTNYRAINLGLTYGQLTGLTEDTTPDTANDFVVTADTSALLLKKVKPSNLMAIASQAEMEAASDTTKAASPGRTQYHPGVAKSWVNWESIGTAAITASHNTTSLTDGGVGDITLNWTTAYSTAGAYTFAGGAKADGAESSGGTVRMDDGTVSTLMSTTSLNVVTLGNTQTKYDTDLATVCCFGDQ